MVWMLGLMIKGSGLMVGGLGLIMGRFGVDGWMLSLEGGNQC